MLLAKRTLTRETQTFIIKNKDLIPLIEAYRFLHPGWLSMFLTPTSAEGCEEGIKVTVEPAK